MLLSGAEGEKEVFAGMVLGCQGSSYPQKQVRMQPDAARGERGCQELWPQALPLPGASSGSCLRSGARTCGQEGQQGQV